MFLLYVAMKLLCLAIICYVFAMQCYVIAMFCYIASRPRNAGLSSDGIQDIRVLKRK